MKEVPGKRLCLYAHHGLKDVVWFIDRNHLQGFGRTEDTLKLEPLDKKLESFRLPGGDCRWARLSIL